MDSILQIKFLFGFTTDSTRCSVSHISAESLYYCMLHQLVYSMPNTHTIQYKHMFFYYVLWSPVEITVSSLQIWQCSDLTQKKNQLPLKLAETWSLANSIHRHIHTQQWSCYIMHWENLFKQYNPAQIWQCGRPEAETFLLMHADQRHRGTHTYTESQTLTHIVEFRRVIHWGQNSKSIYMHPPNDGEGKHHTL